MKSYKRKRSASDYLELVTCIYQDAVAKCTADVSDLRDLQTIQARVEAEGMSFLTITLPQFAKDFEKSLESGGIAPTLFHTFPRVGSRRKKGAIPKFLQGMLGRIFNRETGELILDETPNIVGGAVCASSTIVDAIRQLCRAFAKVELECTKKRTQAALDSYVEVEQSFQEFALRDQDRVDFLHVSDLLWGNMVAKCELSSLFPKHGPGATAERISGNQKFVWQKWYDRLEPYFPLVGSAYPLSIVASNGADEDWDDEPVKRLLEMVSVVPEQDEDPVRVTPVPKTLKGPRIIAIEPVCMQYAQQGIRDWLYSAIDRNPLTAGHVNFRDQTINQRLALKSSRDGQLATIDLSDASDRVPVDLALEMFRGNPGLQEAVNACRSTAAQLPTGEIVSNLRKFASMGSALCFPVEAMYFYTIIVLASLKVSGLSFTRSNIFKVKDELYVYGDDILVPSANAVAVCEYLQRYNCKVNASKSFWTGKFRESCGVDAYLGVNVTPIYVREERPTNRRQSGKLVSWVATANLFEEKGYPRTAQFMYALCERIVGVLPTLSDDSPGLGRKRSLGHWGSWWKDYSFRWNIRYQRIEIRAWVPSPVYREDKLVGYPALVKCLSKLETKDPSKLPHEERLSSQFKSGKDLQNLMVTDTDHLLRSALHGAVTLKRRWVPA